MNDIAARAAEVLKSSPHPALRLSELIELIAERMDRSLTSGRLRVILEDYPEEFRVLETWSGRWAASPSAGVPPADAWVVSILNPGPDADESRRPALRLRESVRWLGRGVDSRSRMEVGRWYAILLSERAARRAFVRVAA